MGHQYKYLLIILLILYTLGVSYIGYHNRNSKTGEDYFLASRTLPPWLLAITFVASWWGGGSAVDLVDQARIQGIGSFWIYGVPVLIATFLMFVFAGAIRRASTLTQPEMMEERYDSRSGFMLTLFIIIFMTVSAASQVIVIGNFFHTFFNISYEWGAVIGTAMVAFYSLFGGFRGVVLTDLLQFIFFLLASIFLLYIISDSAGGFAALAEYSSRPENAEFASFWYGAKNNLAYIVTFGASWMIQANVWQRIAAARNPRDARKMMSISFFTFIPLYIMVTLTGMFSAIVYDTAPSGGVVTDMLLNTQSPVVSALVFVGICSAIMSTMDSLFNTGSLALSIDLYKRHISPSVSQKNLVSIGRLSTLLMASVSLLIAIKIKSVLTISWIGADFLATGAFVPLIAGFLWKRGTSTGAFASMIFGLLFSCYNLASALGAPFPVAWEIASAPQAIVGICSSLLIYISVSLLSKSENDKASAFIRKTLK